MSLAALQRSVVLCHFLITLVTLFQFSLRGFSFKSLHCVISKLSNVNQYWSDLIGPEVKRSTIPEQLLMLGLLGFESLMLITAIFRT